VFCVLLIAEQQINNQQIVLNCNFIAGGGDDSFFFSRSICFGGEIKYIFNQFLRILDLLFWILDFPLLHV